MIGIVKIGKSLANAFSKIIPLAVYLKKYEPYQTEPTST
jgi:hypothetical protein